MKSKSKPNATEKPKYKLKNPDKYLGNPENIVIRSSWELQFFEFCDNNKNILRWSSEEIKIPYMKPTPQGLKPAMYFPDAYIEYVDKNGNLIKELIEIKPEKQSRLSKAKKSTTRMFENAVAVVNFAKWEAAEKWCSQRGIKFSVITEKTLHR
jgi:hypothetical protein